MNDTIEIAVIGEINRVIVEGVADSLRETFNVNVLIGDTLREWCERAYDRKRNQYSAAMLLHCLDLQRKGPLTRLLGVTDHDIFIPEFNYVFGFADEQRSVSVVSLARLRKKGEMPDESRKPYERAVKTAIHELGHTYGLSHCRDHRCVMFFSFNLSDTDYKTKDFCPPCRKALDRKLSPCIAEVP